MHPWKNVTLWLILALAVAALLAASVQAGTGHNGDPSDVVSRYLRSHASLPYDPAGLLRATGAAASPDVFERYAGAHPYGVGVTATPAIVSRGFRWSDYGAGVATGIAVALLFAVGLLAMPMRRRQPTQPAVGR
jgi:hypothetical protein